MQFLSKFVLLIPACSLLLMMSSWRGCDSNKEEAPYHLDAGFWGSEEARLQVKETETTITFVCAMGRVDGQILVSHEDSFEVPGTMVAGPVAFPVRPARFEGSITGNKMTLSITYTDTVEEFGAFELTRGFDSMVGYVCVC